LIDGRIRRRAPGVVAIVIITIIVRRSKFGSTSRIREYLNTLSLSLSLWVGGITRASGSLVAAIPFALSKFNFRKLTLTAVSFLGMEVFITVTLIGPSIFGGRQGAKNGTKSRVGNTHRGDGLALGWI